MTPAKPRAYGHAVSTEPSATPSPIPVKALNTRPKRDLGLDNIVSTPARGSKSPKTPDGAEGASPSIKRQRMTRADSLGHKHVDYDMKHHPMDDVLRPKAAAKRRAYDQPPQQASNNNGNEGSPDEDSDLDVPKPSHRRITDPPTTPERHRITRAATLGEKAVDYDMKHHPMDDVLRPKAAAKRSVWFKSISPPTLSQKTSKASRASTIAQNDPKNPFTKPTMTDWKKLQAFDRRVYLLQKGSPINGNTLPLKWFKVVEALIDDDFFTREQFKAWGGVEALKVRYESTRKGIEGFFNAEPEPTSKMGWLVRHAEGFDVYDKGVGKKYWQSHGDSIVRPPSTKEIKEAVREQGDTENDNGQDDHPEVADSNELRTVDADNDKIDADKELGAHGDKTAEAVLDHNQTVSDASPTLYRIAKQVLEAESHLMESMRSEPSSEVGAPIMGDDELEAILGDMATPATEAVSNDPRIPSSSLSDAEPQFLERRQKMSQQTSVGNNAAIVPKISGSQAKSSLPNNDAGAPSSTVGVVPPSVLKAARRLEQENVHRQSFKKSSHEKSISASSSNSANPDTSATDESLPTCNAPRKVYKRGARATSSSVEFQVHEDQPGNTPLIKKQVALHPKSPGTDVKKENFGHHNRAEPDSTAAHRRLQQALSDSPSARRSERNIATLTGVVVYGPSATLQPSPAFVVADGRTSGIDRMGPNAFVTPLTPRSTRIRRV